ncbi:MAG TPA: hypothetical protein VN843_35100 [Anaerolineales bacterium]|nr:hypothetical protein [Anaerolineales bacterium]
MPTLNWIGKDAVVDHHKQVPFRLLKPIDKFSMSQPKLPEKLQIYMIRAYSGSVL